MNWWHKEAVMGGKQQTPTQYLENNYLRYSDKEIAEVLSAIVGKVVTRNAVKKRRQALGLSKADATQHETIADYTESENNALIDVTENKPLTKEDLIRAYQIDTKLWEFESFSINSWQVGVKNPFGEIETERLYQTKARLSRIEPVEVLPMIKPMRGESKHEARPALKQAQTRVSLIFADPHFGYLRDMRNGKLDPFHSREALDIVLQVAQKTQPDRIDILGDWFDLPDWSDKFIRSPEFYFVTQPAIVESHWVLSLLRDYCPNAQINLHAGNHDKRLENAILKYLPVAYDLRSATKLDLPPALSIPSLLDLNALGINYVSDYPNDIDMLGNSLEIMHGSTARTSFNTVLDIAKRCNTSRIVGHIHRREVASYTHWTGYEYKTVEGICPGCVCRIDGVVPGRSKRQQWQQGIMGVSYTDTEYTYQMLPINNNRMLLDKRLIIGDDYTEQLKRDYPDWQW